MKRAWIPIFISLLILPNIQVWAQEQATLTLSSELFKGNLAGHGLWKKRALHACSENSCPVSERTVGP